MSEPLTVGFVIPENAPKDIEYMSIIVGATDRYMDDLTDTQIMAAINWIKATAEARIAKRKDTPF